MNPREDARRAGLVDYESLSPCRKCGEPGWRRVRDNRCLMCDPATLNRIERELAQNQREQSTKARVRARDKKESRYWSTLPCAVCCEPGWRMVKYNTCLTCVQVPK